MKLLALLCSASVLTFAHRVRRAEYGSVVDQVDDAPDPDSVPSVLPNRNDDADPDITVTGSYNEPCDGCLGGDALLFYRDQYVTLSGTGYFLVRWEIGYGNKAGEIVPPTWTGLTGKLFHVASGGGHRMDDVKTDGTGCMWMGCEGSLDTLPDGMQQMWQNEFYYLEDGSVTLTDNENADYNLGITLYSWSGVNGDINTKGIRYGLTRDTGDDSGPVPQYATCDTPSDLTSVAQYSVVSGC